MSNNDISVSMIIDKNLKKETTQDIINSKQRCNIISVDERRIYSWVDDKIVNNCNNCNIQFTMLIRKHHCRNCGKIFCGVCSENKITIPNKIKTVNKQYNYLDYRTYLDFLNINNKEERVCFKCYKSLNELIKLSKKIQLFDLLSLNVEDYKNISIVCKSWNKISKYYFNKFREIQYNFSDHRYSKYELELLKENKHLFSCHSKWILQLILTTDWNDKNTQQKEIILSILKDKNKNKKCWDLMCSRSCSETLQIEDIVIVISKNYTYIPLIKYLIKLWKSIIENTKVFESFKIQINCYLYVLVNSLHFYKNYTTISLLIEDFLLFLSNKDIYISNQLFWILTPYISNPKSSIYFKEFRKKLVKNLDYQTYISFQNGYDFTQNIIKVAITNKENMLDSIKIYLKEYNTKIDKFVLPINIVKTLKCIDYTKIRMIDSKTKPIILPCVSDDNSICNIMLKKDDIRKEEIIMKIIKLMDYFLKSEENLDLYATTYNILPLSDEYGYIEFVSNSTTLYDIKEVHNFTIQNWILENNNKITIEQLRNNISKSCALYCIITYLLGIGDRHLDNIMITNDAKIFHIDFGYILGNDPKVLSPDIRLTPDMIDAMGGVNSIYYAKFKNYCGIAYNCIRRHSSIFYVLLLEIEQINCKFEKNIITKERIKNYVINRFIPGETYDNAIKQINNRIQVNSNTYSETVIDYFHKKYKLSDSDKNKGIINVANKFLKFTKKNIKKYINHENNI